MNKNNEIQDAKGYHKSMLYSYESQTLLLTTFMNKEKLTLLKQSIAKFKNVSIWIQASNISGEVLNVGGIKVRVLGDNSSDFKFKIKNNKFKN